MKRHSLVLLIRKSLLLIGHPILLFSKVVSFLWRNFLARPAYDSGLFEKWFFYTYSVPHIKKLGYKEAKNLLNEKLKFHKALLKEQDSQKRLELSLNYYNSLFTHPLNEKQSSQNKVRTFGFEDALIEREKDLFSGKIVVDIGCGTGASTAVISKYASLVYGVDCSSIAIEEAKNNFPHLENVKFLVLEKIKIPFEDETVDVVYSNDLIEHLHPSDALAHFHDVWRVLKKGGTYYFWTPSSTTGPHDFTKNFCPRGIGIPSQASHIKEYDLKEITDILKNLNYSKITCPVPDKEVLIKAMK